MALFSLGEFPHNTLGHFFLFPRVFEPCSKLGNSRLKTITDDLMCMNNFENFSIGREC